MCHFVETVTDNLPAEQIWWEFFLKNQLLHKNLNKNLMMNRLKEEEWASPLPRAKLQNLFNTRSVSPFRLQMSQMHREAVELWKSNQCVRETKRPQRRSIRAVTIGCWLRFKATAQIGFRFNENVSDCCPVLCLIRQVKQEIRAWGWNATLTEHSDGEGTPLCDFISSLTQWAETKQARRKQQENQTNINTHSAQGAGWWRETRGGETKHQLMFDTCLMLVPEGTFQCANNQSHPVLQEQTDHY